jgi:putative transposase
MIPKKDEESPTKASKSTNARIAFVLEQAEGGSAIGENCQRINISEATFYNRVSALAA